MLSLFLAAAFAQDGEEAAMDVACMPLQILQTVPSNGATNVPVDTTFSLVYDGSCGGATAWTFEILDPSDDSVVATQAWTWNGAVPALATFDPEADLPANTALVLQATGDGGYYNTLAVEFTTGSGTVQGLSGTLTAEVVSATWYRDSNQAEVITSVTPAADPDGMSLLHIVGGNTQVFLSAADAATVEPALWFTQAAEPAELCVDVSQIDGAGRESEPVTACGDAVIEGGGGLGGHGCGFGRGDTVAVSSPPEPASSGLLLAGAGFLLRRRRNRP